MIFSSVYFIFFLIVVAGMYFVIPEKFRFVWLLLISYIFCLTYSRYSLAVLVYSTLVSYLFGNLIDKVKNSGRSKGGTLICLWCGIILCIIPLILSKTTQYSLFAAIGISFYILQEIGYLVDIYRGKNQSEHNIIKYALFVAFFPKLISGPIERSDNLLKQMEDACEESFDYNRVKSGLILMLWGYFQKNIVADTFSAYVGSVYGQWESYSGVTLVLATILFAFQLYADFAGYTNIAIGVSQILGFKLVENFEQPYLAVSIKEFWRRWHISLSTFLREYVYIPLGGNRNGKMRKYINLVLTFIVSGLWHGTGLNFIVWGILHGGYQVVGECCQKIKSRAVTVLRLHKNNAIHQMLQRIIVFVLVDIAWVFFRASGLKTAIRILGKCVFDFSIGNLSRDIFYSLNIGAIEITLGFCFVVILMVVDLLHEKNIHIRILLDRQPLIVRWVCYMGVLLLLTFVGIRRYGTEASSFIYMQF